MAIIYDNENKTYRIDRAPIISELVGQRGVSPMLSRTYGYLDPATDKLYAGENFGAEIGNQIPVVYGEVLLKGQVLDQGALRADFDPTKVLRVYRFQMGESGAKGVKEGIPGVPDSILQNVLINCEPVQDADTGENKKHGVGIKLNPIPLVAGAGLLAAPFIAKLFKKDPKTGKDIESVNAGAISPDKIIGAGDVSDGQVLVVEGDQIVGKSLAELIQQYVEFTANTCCDGNSNTIANTGGSTGGGTGGDTGNGTSESGAVDGCYQPAQSISTTSTKTPPPEETHGSYKLLKHQGEDNRYYAQPIDMYGKGTLKAHLYFKNGLYLETNDDWELKDNASNAVVNSGTAVCRGAGTVTLRWCIVDEADDKILDEGTYTKTAATEQMFTAHISVPLQTALQAKADAADPCNTTDTTSNQHNNVTLRIYRTDDALSSTDVYFQGIGWTEPEAVPSAEPVSRDPTPVTPPESCPSLSGVEPDDEEAPIEEPTGTYGVDKCDPDDTGGNPGGGNTGNNACCTGTVTVKPKEGTGGTDPTDTAAPTLEATSSKNVLFEPKDASTNFPTFEAHHGANATANATTLTVTFTITQGHGSIEANATANATTFSWDAATNKATITGPEAGVNTVLAGPLKYVPHASDDASWDIKYTGSVKDDANGKTGGLSSTLSLLNSKVERAAKAAEVTIKLAGTTGNVTIKINGVAVSGSVPFDTSIAQTAVDVAGSINATSSSPDYKATYLSGSSIKITAPLGLGSDANGLTVTAETDGDITLVDADGDPTVPKLDGGVTKTEQFRSLGSKIWGFAKNLLPLVGAGLIANTLYKSISQMEIEIPEELVDEDGNVAVVYQGMMVRVPSNYTVGTDGIGGTYSGSWDYSTFAAEPVYTTNPAWCLLDFIESKRYGCGTVIRLTAAQKTRLYQDIYEAAKRCDELVDDGRGGQEPRYTLNTIIANLTRLEALQSLSSTMHAQVLFTSDGVRVAQDRPTAPVHVFTNANVFEDGFDYSGGTLDAAYNWVTVQWNNPERFFRIEETYVTDTGDVVKNGERKNTVRAFGCTSEGQAKRHAAWVMHNEKSNPLIVTFSTTWEGSALLPGDVVVMVDNDEEAHLSSNQFGGRHLSGGTMDRSHTGSQKGWWMGTTGIESATLTFSGTSVSGATIPSMAVVATTNANSGEGCLWKILSVAEHENGEFSITAVKHDLNKYTAIDAFANS